MVAITIDFGVGALIAYGFARTQDPTFAVFAGFLLADFADDLRRWRTGQAR